MAKSVAVHALVDTWFVNCFAQSFSNHRLVKVVSAYDMREGVFTCRGGWKKSPARCFVGSQFFK